MAAKVSIVIPIYNPGALLSRMLDSVLAQTMRDFELICVDDGSTDGTREQLAQYAKEDKRIKVILQKNAGAGAARNNGLLASSGDFVYFCDHDDALHPRLLEFALHCAMKYDADAVFLSSVQVHDEGPICFEDLGDFSGIRTICTDNLFDYLEPKDGFCLSIPPWGYLMRRDIFLAFKDVGQFKYARFGYLVRLFSAAKRAVVTDARLYYYTCFNVSMSRQAISPATIRDFHRSLVDAGKVLNEHDSPVTPAMRRPIMKFLFAKNLKYQLNAIRRSRKALSSEEVHELMRLFGDELSDLQRKGLISWTACNIRHSIFYLILLLSRR